MCLWLGEEPTNIFVYNIKPMKNVAKRIKINLILFNEICRDKFH